MKRILLITLYSVLAFGIGFGITNGVVQFLNTNHDEETHEEIVEEHEHDDAEQEEQIKHEEAEVVSEEATEEVIDEGEEKEKIANEGKEESSVIVEVVEEVSHEEHEEKNVEHESTKRVEEIKETAKPVEKSVAKEPVVTQELGSIKVSKMPIPPVLSIYASMKASFGEIDGKDMNFAFIKKEPSDVEYTPLAEKTRSGRADEVKKTFKLDNTIIGYSYDTGKRKFLPGVAVRIENISTETVTKSITIEVEFRLNGEVYDRVVSKVDYNENYYLVPAFFQRRTLVSKNGIKSMKHAIKGLEAKIYLNDVLLSTKAVTKKEVLDWGFK